MGGRFLILEVLSVIYVNEKYMNSYSISLHPISSAQIQAKR